MEEKTTFPTEIRLLEQSPCKNKKLVGHDLGVCKNMATGSL